MVGSTRRSPRHPRVGFGRIRRPRKEADPSDCRAPQRPRRTNPTSTESAPSRSPERAATPKASRGYSRRAASEPAESLVAPSFPTSPAGTISRFPLGTQTRSITTFYPIGPSLQDWNSLGTSIPRVASKPRLRLVSTPPQAGSRGPPRWGSGEGDPSWAETAPSGAQGKRIRPRLKQLPLGSGKGNHSRPKLLPSGSGEANPSSTATAPSRSPERAATPKASPGCSRRAASEPAESWVAASFPKSPAWTISRIASGTQTPSISTFYSIGPSLQDWNSQGTSIPRVASKPHLGLVSTPPQAGFVSGRPFRALGTRS